MAAAEARAQHPEPAVSRILIVGASGRACAASKRRAGWDPVVIDLFADADTTQLAEVHFCNPADYPHGFVPLASALPPMPWVYTGGLENHPEVVSAISKRHLLLGNGPDVLNLVRDPWYLAALPARSAAFAKVAAREDRAVPVHSLRKPLRGSGGGGIRFADSRDNALDPGYYFQEFVDGTPRSAVFSASGDSPVTLGATEQLIGAPWLHAKPFRYAGSVSKPSAEHPLDGWPQELCRASGLRGTFGLDFVGEGTGARVVEVNPRYPASLEVIELAKCTGRFIGKGVYYAAKSLTFPDSGPWDRSLADCRDVWSVLDYADIPRPGTGIDAGQPVLSLFAVADCEVDCLDGLKFRAAELDRLFEIEAHP